jgi:hypothetical protein
MGWSRAFKDPIPIPGGRQLVTLKDAGNYITKLPKAEHAAPEWQTAMEALILVATHGGPTMFAPGWRTSAESARRAAMTGTLSLFAQHRGFQLTTRCGQTE